MPKPSDYFPGASLEAAPWAAFWSLVIEAADALEIAGRMQEAGTIDEE